MVKDAWYRRPPLYAAIVSGIEFLWITRTGQKFSDVGTNRNLVDALNETGAFGRVVSTVAKPPAIGAGSETSRI
jgi:hypothetical protein